MMQEREFNGEALTDGIWRDVPIDVYNSDCCDGPSVSKSALKSLIPVHGGSPKRFYGHWACNPYRIPPKPPSEAMIFGKAAHCLVLGDEVFSEQFTVHPKWRVEDMGLPEKKRRKWNANSNDCKAFLDEAAENNLMVLKPGQLERIQRMVEDLAGYPLVRQGILNGRVERTLVAKDPSTGIYLKFRPDVIPTDDGMFADLKTASSFDEDFLQKQIGDMGYYLQGAMGRMVCRLLDIPFEEFWLVYTLNDDVPDTAHARLSEFELDRGEKVIRWCLDTMAGCLKSGDWYGARPFSGGERDIHMKPWTATALDDFINHNSPETEAA